jgi:hypothetical protein
MMMKTGVRHASQTKAVLKSIEDRGARIVAVLLPWPIALTTDVNKRINF